MTSSVRCHFFGSFFWSYKKWPFVDKPIFDASEGQALGASSLQQTRSRTRDTNRGTRSESRAITGTAREAHTGSLSLKSLSLSRVTLKRTGAASTPRPPVRRSLSPSSAGFDAVPPACVQRLRSTPPVPVASTPRLPAVAGTLCSRRAHPRYLEQTAPESLQGFVPGACGDLAGGAAVEKWSKPFMSRRYSAETADRVLGRWGGQRAS